MNVEAYKCVLFPPFFWVVLLDILSIFSPRKLGEMIQFDDDIFQIGGCNQHLVNYLEILGGSSQLHGKTTARR